jgi:glycosyltransferase involved in cell wall biosynthesis
MRILIAVPFDEERGGVAYVTGNLARELQRRGHEVMFVFPGKNYRIKQKLTKFRFPGFEMRMQCPFGERNPIISLLAFLILFPIGIYQILSLLRKNGIQIINIHYPTDCFFYLAVCSRILDKALLTSVHGADLFPDGVPRATYSRAFRFLLKSSKLIVSPSRFLEQMVLTQWPELAGKTTYSHNGIDLNELNSISFRIKSATQHPYVFCVSAYKPQKAVEVLIHAFAFVHGTYPELRLVIVGNGPLHAELSELAHSLGISKQTQLLGSKGRADTIRLLRACKLFVLPSRFETFGIVILEAMACEKPLVASAAGGIPEIVQNDVNGILVEPDNPKTLAQAMNRVLSDEILQTRLASNGLKTAREQFDFTRTAGSYEAVFSRFKQTRPQSTSSKPASSSS